MNQLSDITLNNVTLNNCYTSVLTAGTTTTSNTINMFENTIITIGAYSITGLELAKKLQLLDRIITKDYPELQI